MRDGAFPFRRARSFLNVSSGRAFLFCRRHNDNATTVIDRRYRVSDVAAAVRGCERLSSLRGNDLPRSVVLQLCALDAITHDVMRRDAVRVSMPVFAHAIVSSKDVCGCDLSLIHVALVSSSCANRVSAAEVSRRRVGLWTNRSRSLVSLRQRHVFPREYAPSLPGQIRLLGLRETFPLACLHEPVRLFPLLA